VVDQAGVRDAAGHSPNHTRRLILYQDRHPSCFQNFYTMETVPFMMTANTAPPYTSATDANSASTAGRQEFCRGD
jgi:hypothetical protein